MEFPRQITVIQATIIIASTIIGVGILALPRIAVDAVDTGAPLVTLLGIILSFIGLWLITMLGMRFPNKSIIQYGEDILGAWLARMFSMLIIIFFAVLTSLTAREFGEVVVTSVLRETPLEVTIITMLLLAALPTRNNTTTFAYIHHFYFPLILAPALLIVAFSAKNANTIYLLPVWGNEPAGMFNGLLVITTLFQGSFILTIVIPAMRRPDRAITASMWGMFFAGGLYLVIVIASVAVFGSEEIKLLQWPTLELARMTSFPGEVLERLDALFLVVWVTAVFTTLFSSYFFTIHASSQLFHLRDHRMLSFFVLPLIFMLSMLPQNILSLYEIIETVGRTGLLITILYPFLLFVVAVIRKKRGAAYAGQKMDETG